MAQQQRAAEQRKRRYSDERKTVSDCKYQIHATGGRFCLLFPSHNRCLIALLFSLVALISHQPMEVRVKPLLWFYNSGNTVAFIGVAANTQLTRLWSVKAGVVACETS